MSIVYSHITTTESSGSRYRGTSLIRNTPLLGTYSRTIQGPMVVLGGGLFLMSEVPLHVGAEPHSPPQLPSREGIT